ncbi:ketosynthase chain-length factor [Yinghuangia sp. ASG 101]|uniref:ketosynthase chain-length factor n=1 Tax=Yinghuangia sp. ASG 101 TaxID=2896848 RepID=UPI001E36DA4F|nr:ketosynthase chain-length factor [Yinghuangia sp. ASG 101]UGQ11788.1 ketosynthase chain-length factor [Yinghuangia sp. ASG 101]
MTDTATATTTGTTTAEAPAGGTGGARGRALVTGIGVLAPGGLGTEEYWASVLAGRGGIGPVAAYDASRYPTSHAGQVAGFTAADHIPSRLMPQTDPMTRFALAAADWAVRDSGADPRELDDFSMGVVTANAAGGFEFTQGEVQKLWTRGPSHVSAYQSFAWFYAVNTGQISIRQGMRGPSGVLVADQAAGLDAIGHARRHVRRGTALVVTGGMEAPLNPYALVSQIAHGRLSRANRFVPFDRRADGYLPGEGGAILVLEDADAFRARGGTRAYGEVTGYAAAFDPAPGSGRPRGPWRAITAALADARLRPEEIDVVFADAAGDPVADREEADALCRVFGPRGVPVTAPKTMTGRLLSGGPPVDVAAALLALRDQVVPPTIGITDPDPDLGLDLVRDTPRAATLRTALIVARGHGGFNSALVVSLP